MGTQRRHYGVSWFRYTNSKWKSVRSAPLLHTVSFSIDDDGTVRNHQNLFRYSILLHRLLL